MATSMKARSSWVFDAQAAAVEGGQEAGLAEDLRVVDRGVGLVAVEVQRRGSRRD